MAGRRAAAEVCEPVPVEISDEALRSELIAVGFTPGPITDTTRDPLIRHLRRLSSSPTKKGTKKKVSSVALSTCNPGPSDHPNPPAPSRPSGLPDHSNPPAPSDHHDPEPPDCRERPESPDSHEHSEPLDHTDSPDIFISYNRKSTPEDFLSHLESYLQESGYSIWRDSTSIAGGKEWHSAVAEAIISSKAFLCIITSQYLSSQFCTKELYLAEGKGKTIFPVFLEDVNLDQCPGVTLTLSSLNWIQPLKSLKLDRNPAWELVAQEVRNSVVSSLGTKQQVKSLTDYNVQEVCAAMERLELDSAEFKANSVDGRLLIELTDKEMKKELKLRPLQIKKLKQFIASSS